MKTLIRNKYIDLSTVVSLEFDTRYDFYHPDDNEVVFTFFSTDKEIRLRADYSKVKPFCLFKVEGKATLEPYLKLIPNTSGKEDLQWFSEDERDKLRFKGDFIYLEEDYVKVWNTFKEDILDKWNKTESAIKDIQIYK